MNRQQCLTQIEANERALRLEAGSVSEKDYKKLVTLHLQLIAALKEAQPAKRQGADAPAARKKTP